MSLFKGIFPPPEAPPVWSKKTEPHLKHLKSENVEIDDDEFTEMLKENEKLISSMKQSNTNIIEQGITSPIILRKEVRKEVSFGRELKASKAGTNIQGAASKEKSVITNDTPTSYIVVKDQEIIEIETKDQNLFEIASNMHAAEAKPIQGKKRRNYIDIKIDANLQEEDPQFFLDHIIASVRSDTVLSPWGLALKQIIRNWNRIFISPFNDDQVLTKH